MSILTTLTHAPRLKADIQGLNTSALMAIARCAQHLNEVSLRLETPNARETNAEVARHLIDKAHTVLVKQCVQRCSHLVHDTWAYLLEDTLSYWEQVLYIEHLLDQVVELLKKPAD
jgi:hypothetical protein